MVGNATSLTGKGLRDWLLQRLTAVVLLAYVIVLSVFWFRHPYMDYDTWHGFFSCIWIKIFSLVVWFSIFLHGWIGLWTVTTDYIKCYCLRLTLQALIFLTLLGMFFGSILVFCGV